MIDNNDLTSTWSHDEDVANSKPAEYSKAVSEPLLTISSHISSLLQANKSNHLQFLQSCENNDINLSFCENYKKESDIIMNQANCFSNMKTDICGNEKYVIKPTNEDKLDNTINNSNQIDNVDLVQNLYPPNSWPSDPSKSRKITFSIFEPKRAKHMDLISNTENMLQRNKKLQFLTKNDPETSSQIAKTIEKEIINELFVERETDYTTAPSTSQISLNVKQQATNVVESLGKSSQCVSDELFSDNDHEIILDDNLARHIKKYISNSQPDMHRSSANNKSSRLNVSASSKLNWPLFSHKFSSQVSTVKLQEPPNILNVDSTTLNSSERSNLYLMASLLQHEVSFLKEESRFKQDFASQRIDGPHLLSSDLKLNKEPLSKSNEQHLIPSTNITLDKQCNENSVSMMETEEGDEGNLETCNNKETNSTTNLQPTYSSIKNNHHNAQTLNLYSGSVSSSFCELPPVKPECLRNESEVYESVNQTDENIHDLLSTFKEISPTKLCPRDRSTVYEISKRDTSPQQVSSSFCNIANESLQHRYKRNPFNICKTDCEYLEIPRSPEVLMNLDGTAYPLSSLESIPSSLPTDGDLQHTLPSSEGLKCSLLNAEGIASSRDLDCTLPSDEDIRCTLPSNGDIQCTLPNDEGIHCSLTSVQDALCKLPSGNDVPYLSPQAENSPCTLLSPRAIPLVGGIPRCESITLTLPHMEDLPCKLLENGGISISESMSCILPSIENIPCNLPYDGDIPSGNGSQNKLSAVEDISSKLPNCKSISYILPKVEDIPCKLLSAGKSCSLSNGGDIPISSPCIGVVPCLISGGDHIVPQFEDTERVVAESSKHASETNLILSGNKILTEEIKQPQLPEAQITYSAPMNYESMHSFKTRYSRPKNEIETCSSYSQHRTRVNSTVSINLDNSKENKHPSSLTGELAVYQQTNETPPILSFEDKTLYNEHRVPEADSYDNMCLNEVSLYTNFLEDKQGDGMIKQPGKQAFQWKSVYESVLNKSITAHSTADSTFEGLSSLQPIVPSHRPLRVGLSKKQKVKHLHNKPQQLLSSD